MLALYYQIYILMLLSHLPYSLLYPLLFITIYISSNFHFSHSLLSSLSHYLLMHYFTMLLYYNHLVLYYMYYLSAIYNTMSDSLPIMHFRSLSLLLLLCGSFMFIHLSDLMLSLAFLYLYSWPLNLYIPSSFMLYHLLLHYMFNYMMILNNFMMIHLFMLSHLFIMSSSLLHFHLSMYLMLVNNSMFNILDLLYLILSYLLYHLSYFLIHL